MDWLKAGVGEENASGNPRRADRSDRICAPRCSQCGVLAGYIGDLVAIRPVLGLGAIPSLRPTAAQSQKHGPNRSSAETSQY